MRIAIDRSGACRRVCVFVRAVAPCLLGCSFVRVAAVPFAAPSAVSMSEAFFDDRLFVVLIPMSVISES
jgi:hypothetical protein